MQTQLQSKMQPEGKKQAFTLYVTFIFVWKPCLFNQNVVYSMNSCYKETK